MSTQPAVQLVPGQVMHARMKPVAHRFTYRVFNLLIDLDRLDEANAISRLFRIGRFALAGFDVRDHGAASAAALRTSITADLTQAGYQGTVGQILIWCYPRILGHVFDPLSIYFVHDEAGVLQALVYAVRNTFGERHVYPCPIQPHERGPEGIRQEQDKLFYVSPFIDMRMRYHFRISPPGETLKVRILETDAEGPILSATFAGRTEALTTRSLLRAFARAPLLGFKVVGGIHWEAAKLWFKGVRYYGTDKPVDTRPPARLTTLRQP